jgi:hypothetical protein
MSTTFLSGMSWSWHDRLRAAGIHLLLSCVVAALVAALVFLVWYPYPYRELVGGRELFFIVVAVDVVMGPLLTLAVFDRKKGWPHLRRDLAVIGLLQLAALAYGVYVVSVARPVHMAFEIDRFRAVTAADIDNSLLAEARAEFRALPWSGPTLIASIKPTDPKEFQRSVDLGLQGIDLGLQPGTWRAYDSARRADAKARAKPLADVLKRLSGKPEEVALRAAAARSGLAVDKLWVLPLVTRQIYWAALIDERAEPVEYAAADVFEAM